jgi:hypothetical protein
MSTTAYADYKGWTITIGSDSHLIGRSYRTVVWCYATSTTGQTTEKAHAYDMDDEYNATCRRVDRIEEARK